MYFDLIYVKNIWASLIAQLVNKETACNAGDPGSIPGSGRSPGEGIGYPLQYSWASLVTQLVKNPPAMWETWVWTLGWERLPTSVFWPGEFQGLYNPWGCKELDMTERLSLSHQNIFIFHNILGSYFHMPNTGGNTCWQRSFHFEMLWVNFSDILLPTLNEATNKQMETYWELGTMRLH